MAQISLGDPVKKRREFATKIAHRQAYSYVSCWNFHLHPLYVQSSLRTKTQWRSLVVEVGAKSSEEHFLSS